MRFARHSQSSILNATLRPSRGRRGMRAALAAASLLLAATAHAGDACPCLGDLSGNGIVDGADLGVLLAAWGPCAGCAADVSGNGTVDGADLGILLSAWGPCDAGVPNDSCADALTVVSFTGSANPFCTIGATTDGPSVPSACSVPAIDAIAHDVWFRVVVPADGTYQLGACADFPVRMAVYAATPGAGCPCSGGSSFGTVLACAGTDAYPTCAQGAAVLVPAIAGQCLLVRLGGATGQQGTGNLDINIYAPPCALVATTTLSAGGVDADSEFGLAIGMDADTAVVTAFYDDILFGPSNAGSARVYGWNGLNWTAQQTLLSPDPFTSERFGLDATVSGAWIIVGAGAATPQCATDPNCDSGAAHIYASSGGTWTHDQTLLPSASSPEDQYGFRVDIDGSRAIVSAAGDDNANGDRAGAAYVYEYLALFGGVWVQQSKLLAPGGVNFDQFGSDVAVSGTWAVVGADGTDGPNGSNSGKAHVYRDESGGWAHKQALAPAGLPSGANFGRAVAIEGTIAVIGAPGNASSPGAAYVYENFGALGWLQVAVLTAHDGMPGDRFGASVAVSGTQVLVGATGDDAFRGAAYVFWRVSGGWIERAKLSSIDGTASDSMGIVAIANGRGLVGAFLEDVGTSIDRGAVHVFKGLGDCTGNGVVDGCDIAAGLADSDGDGTPDICEP